MIEPCKGCEQDRCNTHLGDPLISDADLDAEISTHPDYWLADHIAAMAAIAKAEGRS